MADVLNVVILRRRQRLRNIRREWMLRDRENPFELTEQAFRAIYRLPRCAVRNLCQELKDFLGASKQGYSVEMQVLGCLQVLGSGSFQNTTGGLAYLQMSQSTVSRNMDKFLDAMMNLTQKYISFPTNSSDLLKTKQEFYEYTQFPNVIGAIDCTHVYICRPATNDWFSYLDRKSRFSLNIQMVCDLNLKITDVVARWPGSCHDSFIWKMCGLRKILASGAVPPKNFLLGDSGYPLEPWLLTPFLDASSHRQERYNARQRRARNVIERCFDVLKSRFRCLDTSGGALQYTPEKVCKIIMACCVLHNICIQHNVESEIETSDSTTDNSGGNLPPVQNSTEDQRLRDLGLRYREEISLQM